MNISSNTGVQASLWTSEVSVRKYSNALDTTLKEEMEGKGESEQAQERGRKGGRDGGIEGGSE